MRVASCVGGTELVVPREILEGESWPPASFGREPENGSRWSEE